VKLSDSAADESAALGARRHARRPSGPGSPIPALHRPQEIFNRLFQPYGGAGVEEVRARLKREASILDLMLDHSRGLKNRLGREDQGKVEEYLESVRAVEQRVERYAAAAEPSAEGGRNDAAFRLAGHLLAFRTLDGRRPDRETVAGALREWNRRNRPPLEDGELTGCLRSAGRNGSPRPDRLVVDRESARRRLESALAGGGPAAALADADLMKAVAVLRRNGDAGYDGCRERLESAGAPPADLDARLAEAAAETDAADTSAFRARPSPAANPLAAPDRRQGLYAPAGARRAPGRGPTGGGAGP
jgi:hypothetical protein